MARRSPAPLSRPFQPSDLVPEPPRHGPRLVARALVGGALLAAAVVAWRWLEGEPPAHDQVQVLQTLPQSDASRTATPSAVTYPFAKDDRTADPVAPQAPSPPEPKPVALPAPPGVTAQQWQALVAEWSPRPDGARELARLDAYFRFADTVRQFRELNRATDAEPTPALVALARRIDAELDRHVAQNELDGSEAYDIKATLLEVLEPDADAADEKLERWAASLPRSPNGTHRPSIPSGNGPAREAQR